MTIALLRRQFHRVESVLQNKKVKAESIDKDQLRIHVGFHFIENEVKEKSYLVCGSTVRNYVNITNY